MILEKQQQQGLASKDFEILEELAASASGQVFKAKWKTRQQVVILKEKKYSELGKQNNVLHEHNLLKKMQHPNIVQCLGWFWRDKNASQRAVHCMVLEYCEAGDFYNIIKKRKANNEY